MRLTLLAGVVLSFTSLAVVEQARAQDVVCDLAEAQREMTQAMLLARMHVNRDEQRLLDMEAAFVRAALLYTACLRPGDADAVELRFTIGDAYRRGHRLREAIVAFAQVRDGAPTHPLATRAAEGIVDCLRQMVDEERARRDFDAGIWPPAWDVVPGATMDSVTQELVAARSSYIARSDADATTAMTFRIANARLLLRHGRHADARVHFAPVLEAHCAGTDASTVGLEAYQGLVDIALAMSDRAEVRRLERWIEEHECTFSPERRWRPTGAFTTAVLEVEDPALRALAERAWAIERTGDTRRALHAYLELARRSDDAFLRADALSRAAAMAPSQHGRETLLRAMRAFLREQDSHAIDARIEVQLALTGLLESSPHRETEARSSRVALAWLAESAALPPSWPSAQGVARAALALALASVSELEASLVVAPGRQATVQAYVQTLREQIAHGTQRVRGIESILDVARVSHERIAALVVIGRAYDALARAIADAVLVPIPVDLQRRMRGVLHHHEVQLQFDDQVRDVLEDQLRPLQCVGVTHYARALADAETLGVEDPMIDVARDRLRTSREPVEQCLFGQPRLLRVARAAVSAPPHGRTLDDATHGPPALARAD